MVQVTSYTAKGVREDLSDVMWSISPTDTPFVSNIAKNEKATQGYHQWQVYDLNPADKDNAGVEGDTFPTASNVATVQVGNYTQIFRKKVSVSDSVEAFNLAGRKSELAFQISNALSEIKLDIEAAAVSENASSAGSGSTARKMAGAEAWITTNADHEATGSTPGFSGSTVGAVVDGVQRAFTEDMFLDSMEAAWAVGGKPTMALVAGTKKRAISGFSGNATKYRDISDKRLVGAVDIYVTDFGDIEVVPSRHVRARTVMLIEPEKFALAVARPVKKVELAKTADATDYGLVTELTLVCRNEKAHSKIADLT